MEEVRTYSTNTDIDPEPYKPAFILINPEAKEDYLLDGRYLVRAPRRGRWVVEEYKNSIDGSLYKRYRCSECGCPTVMFIRSPYCSNCGAKMDGEIDG